MLGEFAALLQRELRGGDTLARVGGEEFAVVLFGVGLPRGRRLRRADRPRAGRPSDPARGPALSASAGVAALLRRARPGRAAARRRSCALCRQGGRTSARGRVGRRRHADRRAHPRRGADTRRAGARRARRLSDAARAEGAAPRTFAAQPPWPANWIFLPGFVHCCGIVYFGTLNLPDAHLKPSVGLPAVERRDDFVGRVAAHSLRDDLLDREFEFRLRLARFGFLFDHDRVVAAGVRARRPRPPGSARAPRARAPGRFRSWRSPCHLRTALIQPSFGPAGAPVTPRFGGAYRRRSGAHTYEYAHRDAVSSAETRSAGDAAGGAGGGPMSPASAGYVIFL